MKARMFFHSLIPAALALAACSQAVTALPESGRTLKPVTETPAVFTDPEPGQTVAGKCGRSSDEVRLLINAVQGYCLQYPPEYDVFYPNESEIMLFKRSVLNVSEPSVRIRIQPAGEGTLQQAADQIAQVYAIPGMEPIRESLTIDGEEAILLAGLSGQDPNRQVVVLHNDYLYYLFFIEMDKSKPEVYAQSEVLYNTVLQSFNFSPGSNACPGCPAAEEETQTAMISGWVWHDQCDSGKDGQPAPVTTPPGCVKEDSPLGSYHADGVLATDEPLIEGVVVTLGEGACPATELAEASTIITDLSYSFTGLRAGEYCVSIDPQREPNFSILRPGEWTYPMVTQDVISASVTLGSGEYKGMLNFGWDYQFQP